MPKLISKCLVPDGKFIGIDWFSTEHTDFKNGTSQCDSNTISSFSSGQFTGVGKVHFSDKNHIVGLFKGFEIIILEHKEVIREIPSDGHKFASWNFIAKK